MPLNKTVPFRKASQVRVRLPFLANSRRISPAVLANDFQSVILYDSDGQFAGIRRPGSGTPIEVSDMKLTIDDIAGSTGLEIKYDPGVPLVYTGSTKLSLSSPLTTLSVSQASPL